MSESREMRQTKIKFKFNEIKTTQAASLFIKKAGGKINYMKLIKLLYLADREALLTWERPLTGDAYFAMKHGPVLSNVLDTISIGKYTSVKSYWYDHISEPEHYEVKLDSEPDIDSLSEREVALIDEIFEKFGDFNQWDLVDICHEMLPEWNDPGDTSKKIEIADILNAEHIPADEIKRIAEEVDNINYAKDLLSIDD